MNWSPLRLRQKRWKLAYIVVGLALGLGLNYLLLRLDIDVVTSALSGFTQLAWVYFATRIFRWRNEMYLAPRAWWRMTGRSTAGFVLSALWLWGVLNSVALLLVGQNLAVWAFGTAPLIVLTTLYVVSSIRLFRQEPRREPLPRT